MNLNISQMSIPEQILYGGFFVGLVGETGCGKTTVMTWFAFWINERLKEENLDIGLYSNYQFLDIPKEGLKWNYKQLKHPDELLEIERGFCFIDEIWRWLMDSYGTMKNAKKGYDDLCADSRKTGKGYFASSQRFMRIDPNFRENIHYIIFPQLFYDVYDRPYKIAVYILNNQTEEPEGEPFSIDPNPVFKMFRTTDKIHRFDSIIEHINLDKLAKEFNEWNTITTNEHQIVKQKITQSLVDLFLNQHPKGLYDRLTENERKMFRTYIQRIGY